MKGTSMVRKFDILDLTMTVYDDNGNVLPSDTVIDGEDLQFTLSLYLELVRTERNSRLQLCDWTQLPDNPLLDSQKQQWQEYRQQLRDFPSQLVWNESHWPVSP